MQNNLKKRNQRGWKYGLSVMLAFLPFLTVFLGIVDAPVANAQVVAQLDANMDATWKRTDLYVAQGSISRSWMWGPQAFNIRLEDYEGAPAGGQVTTAGKRLVAYYDKSRMEINNPNGNRADKYFVTNGLLVKEMISGKRAFGDNKTISYIPSSIIPVVGDGSLYLNRAPTYASLLGVTSLRPEQNRAESRLNQIVTSYIDVNSTSVRDDLQYIKYDVKNVYYDTVFGHNVPKVFWDFMNSRGDVLENGQRLDGPVVDWLFSTGYPITEAYWTTGRVNGVEKDILFQCFERRCFSYTPSNPDGFKVEMGNVGRHYYSWRYESPVTTCNYLPKRGFGKVWEENPSVKGRIGCPNYDYEKALTGATLEFEHGKMYYTGGPNKELPIIILFDDGTWLRVASNWKDGDPLKAGLTPPTGLYEPGRGFGEVWRNQTTLRLPERLGWAKAPDESPTKIAYQDFTFGAMVWLGAKEEILVTYDYYPYGRIYETYSDAFKG